MRIHQTKYVQITMSHNHFIPHQSIMNKDQTAKHTLSPVLVVAEVEATGKGFKAASERRRGRPVVSPEFKRSMACK